MSYSKRLDQSEIVDKLLLEVGISKKASSNHPATRSEKIGSLGQINHPAVKTSEILSLHQARIARREGRFVKIAGKHDLYQDVETKNFWKISDDKKNLIRLFKEDNGIVKE
jgi:hypothetical protein